MPDLVKRIVQLDPALLRGLIVAAALLLASFGVVISNNTQTAILGFIAAIIALLQGLWTRNAVTPNAKVAVVIPDPINAPHIVAPGSAVTTAPESDIIAAAKAVPNVSTPSQ